MLSRVKVFENGGFSRKCLHHAHSIDMLGLKLSKNEQSSMVDIFVFVVQSKINFIFDCHSLELTVAR